MGWILCLLALVVLVVAAGAGARRLLRQTYDAMADGRWEPRPPGPEHARLAPVVAAREAEGYVVDSHGSARRPGASAAVSRHQAARRWVEGHGVHAVPVVRGGVGPVIESGLRAAARQRPTESLLVLRWRVVTGGGRHRTPLAERDDLVPLLWDVRRRQAGAGSEPGRAGSSR